MSRGHAALLPPEDRLESIAVRLRAHEWVRDARLLGYASGAGSGAGARKVTALVVPSGPGVHALRRGGRQLLVAAWERHLRVAVTAADRGYDWRLLDALPPAGSEAELLSAVPDGMPVVDALVRDDQSVSLTCRLLIPFELPIFAGHFPSTPIVPGIVQVGWAIDLARAHGLVAEAFQGISTAKFRRLVQPGMRLALRLEHAPASGQLRFEYTLGPAVVSTGRIQFGGAHA